MNMFIAALVFVCLLTIAIATMVWSFGGSWPLRDKTLLAKAVIGRPGVTRVQKRWSLVVMVAAFATGVFALSLADKVAGGPSTTLLGLVFAALFIARGVAGYTAPWARLFPEEPFRTLDRKNYAPMSFVVGLGFLLLVILRLT